MPSFDLKDYNTVAERLTQSKDEVQHISTEAPVMLTDIMGYVRATISLKDGRTATGMAHFRLDAQRGPEATDPIEKCETSAIGRALKHLGYGVSREEMQRIQHNQQQEQQQRPAPAQAKPTVDVSGAAAMFWNEFSPIVNGVGNWNGVSELLGQPVTAPTTIDGWRELLKATRQAMKEQTASVPA